MAKNQNKSAPVAVNKTEAEAEAAAKAAAEAEAAAKAAAEAEETDEDAVRTYPWTGKATNNTPISIYLSEAGVHLAANYHAPANTAEVTYQSADHYAREMANVDAIASVHRFDNPLTLSELDEAAT